MYSAEGIKFKIFEGKSAKLLEDAVNHFLKEISSKNFQIVDLKCNVDKEEYSTSYNAYIVYKEV